MKTKTFMYEDDNLKVEIEVFEATVLAGIKRMCLQTEASEMPSEEGPDAFERSLLRRFTYPDMIAATRRIKGVWTREENGEENGEAEPFPWPIPFEEFLCLPFPFQAEWERELYELNPFWLVRTPDKKKASENPPSSISDSPAGIVTETETTT